MGHAKYGRGFVAVYNTVQNKNKRQLIWAILWSFISLLNVCSRLHWVCESTSDISSWLEIGCSRDDEPGMFLIFSCGTSLEMAAAAISGTIALLVAEGRFVLFHET
jgi:hypothetical protein